MNMRFKSLTLMTSLVLIFAIGCAKSKGEKFTDDNLSDMLSPDEVAEEIGEKPEAKSINEPNKEARLQIVVDKARGGFNSTAQTMKVYLDKQLIYDWKISTGREQWEESVSGKRYFSRTPVGRFRIYRRAKDYFSYTWQAPMPFAQFIIGGVAMHATTKSHYNELGSRA